MSLLAVLVLAAQDDVFETKIRPLLAERCYACHDAPKAKGGLRLDEPDALRRVASSGDLLRAVRYGDPALRMPPKEKLPAPALAELEAWIAQGAPLPATPWDLRKTWLFTPPAEPAFPAGSANPIDAFLDAKIKERGLRASPPADRRTLLRRLTYDLTGLPPTPEEMQAFLADGDVAKVVDRLLASPHYGERWGRHWLDLARYAVVREDQAAQRKEPSEIPEAWRYRDWVVDAFNRDLPYDRFIEHQVAGDLLSTNDGLVASGFLAIGEWGIQNDHPEKMVWDTADELIDAVGRTFLGLTLACARCHDHKFDPVTTRDYYALAGIFISTHVVAKPAQVGKHTPMVRAAIDKGTALAAQEGGIPETSYAGVQDARVRIRGDVHRLGDVVPRGVPAVLGPPTSVTSGSGRRELARWLASRENPLTARVMANRIWRHHFGEGLVRTPSNFGKLGEAPTHPELLDWLARRFVEDGWSVKALHRRILLSEAYRRSSAPTREALERDPDNRLLARMNRRRLEAEAFRDALLAVAGLLDRSPGGPADPNPDSRRRMIYLRVSRTSKSAFEALFDGADSTAHTDRRNVSTVAPQALFLLNHPFVRDVAASLADVPVDLLYERLYGRPPSPEEVEEARALGGAERARALLLANEFVTVD
jgi:hypothetical protein